MSLDVSHEIAARLLSEAHRQGISIDALLDRFMSARGPDAVPAGAGPAAELPIWRLGNGGAFHRRDIYDDVG